MDTLHPLQRLLAAIAGLLVMADLAWWWLGHFQVDPVYAQMGLLGLALLGVGLFYQTRRPDPALAAMLLGASFLVIFSAAASLLNSFALTVAGPNSDALLDRFDRALGFDWYAMAVTMARHPWLNGALFAAYNLVLPEIALVIVVLGWRGNADKLYRFCIAVALGALLAIFIWSLAPAFGAMTLYHLPPEVSARLVLSMTGEIGRAQLALLRNGPGFITPDVLHGSLIGFPSYHGTLALIMSWHAWHLRRLRWPLLAINAVVLISTPIQGGHHLVDVLAAFPLAALALFITARAGQGRKKSIMVNEGPKFTISPVPQGFFRISATQNSSTPSNAIKSKLSGVS